MHPCRLSALSAHVTSTAGRSMTRAGRAGVWEKVWNDGDKVGFLIAAYDKH